MSHDLSHAQIADNQASFRRANERIEAAADSMGLLEPFPFICECADLTCAELVHLTMDEYEDVRRYSRHFLITPGHQRIAEQVGAGVVREEHDEYFVVEKIGVAGELAEDAYRELAD